MFQPETQSNCVVHFVERAIYRRFQESKATRWFGFDKFKKIVYGIRYADNRKWELRKLNIFAKTENCVKVLETEEFDHTTAQINLSGELIALSSYKAIPIQGCLMKFSLMSVETGKFLKHSFIRDAVPKPIVFLEYVELINVSRQHWIVKCFCGSPEALYFNLELFTAAELTEGQLVFITSCINHTTYFGFYNDLVLEERILFTVVLTETNELSVRIYNLHTNEWYHEVSINQFNFSPLIVDEWSGIPVGYHDQNLFTILKDSRKFMKYNCNFNVWKVFELDIEFNYLGYNLPYYGFTTEELMFINHSMKDVFDKERYECVVLNYNVLSLKDLSMKRIANYFHRFFCDMVESNIVVQLSLPRTLIRQYFGPDWTIK